MLIASELSTVASRNVKLLSFGEDEGGEEEEEPVVFKKAIFRPDRMR